MPDERERPGARPSSRRSFPPALRRAEARKIDAAVDDVQRVAGKTRARCFVAVRAEHG